MSQWLIFNGAASGAAQPAKVTTGTAIKTMQQVAISATQGAEVVEWGVSFDGSAAATPIEVELVETSLAATVTANVQADIIPYDAKAVQMGNVTTDIIQVGTTTTGFTSTSENAASGTFRTFDTQLLAPTNQYVKQFPLGARPYLKPGFYLRVRVTAGAAVSAYTYVIIEI